MFSFDRLVTPKIISAFYIFTVVVLLFMAIASFLANGMNAWSVVAIALAIFSRIFFECIMVSFKNNEYLRRIAEALEKK